MKNRKNPRTRRLLVVEDDPNFRGSLVDYLESKKYVVEIVETESAAIALLRRKTFDAAIVDLQLKDEITHKGGINVLREIRLLDEGVKGIVLTASTKMSDAKASFDQDMFGLLLKQEVKPSDVLKELERLFEDQGEGKLFGEFPALHAYLAAPDIAAIWEDHVFRCIGCTFDHLRRALWNSLSRHLPILRTKDGEPSFRLVPERKAVSGLFWSKAEGFPIWLSAATNGDSLIEPPKKFEADPIYRHSVSKKITVAIWRLLGVDREMFADYIMDKPWETK